MEQNKNIFWNKAMSWGLITALALIVYTSFLYATKSLNSGFLGLFSFAIYVSGIILCGRSYKNSLSENVPFSYSKALGLGVATMLFASIVMAVYNFVLYKFIDPELIEQTLSIIEEQSLNMGSNEDIIEQQMILMRKVYTPFAISIGSIFGGVFYGLIISLFTSFFIQKKEKDPFSAAMKQIDDEE